MRKIKKIGIALLVFSTVLLNTVVMSEKVNAAEETPLSVISIDAGRKYFSQDQLIQIVEKAYQNGYTSVQILLGNDGLRFVLDDMSLSVNGKTYASNDVKAAITKGNNSYYKDPNGDVLTQAEMNKVLAYAKERNIDIIPVINSPGHMDAILVAMEDLGLTNVRFANNGKVSERTVNIENEEAINFVEELVKKYVGYFASSGATKIFNFGADEYANDVFSNPGWGELQNKGLYGKFIDFANDLSKIIKDAGLKPMCFNDGIYYNNKTNFGTFDKDIIISYWTSGWWGFNVAKPDMFASKGHAILNTNDGWYWVLGRIDTGSYNFKDALARTKVNEFNVLAGNSKVASIGSMQAIWADEPSADHGMDNIMQLMDAFSNKHRDILIRPADYSSVDAALKAIPTDQSIYTAESLAALQSTINNVVRGYKENRQVEVTAMAQAIVDATSKLVIKGADYSKVNEAISKASALDKTKYSNFDVVTKAVDAVVTGLDITEQEKVDKMATDILNAIASLKETEKPVTPKDSKTTTPSTGSSSNIAMFTVMLGISSIAIIAYKKKRYTKD